ncbi:MULTISPECIES: beta-ribofuranosylaminobenzene 5'-phosphate synthase [Methanocalculus]|uniref:beta-ribofuranosylaminobenzene 5'-phosphate synthase n=1 Tax=Methanocalculus TaxID=71151 RepID=UPI00209E3A3B|nr:beta-ribofuranosylaminobenzene 5'-phosphate synthase [Methanocalculus sp. AMF5]MCP1662616.1 beta-ribofuranosylaminobenzene 5'-phosphate synthase [Methanocalculus sp. AMF5]
MDLKDSIHPLGPTEIAMRMREIEMYTGSLSPFQKVLLGTDGSVTHLLSLATESNVGVKTRLQEVLSADREVSRLLAIREGDSVNHRIVDLGEGKGGRPLIYAISYTPIDRLASGMKTDMMKADIPIGIILKKHKIESRREILTIDSYPADEHLADVFGILPGEPLFARRYRIIHKDEPLMVITEIFPSGTFADTKRVIVDAPSRIHLGLIDLNGSLGRVDGGIGITLDRPHILVEARAADRVSVHGGDEESRQRAAEAADAVMNAFGLTGGAGIILHTLLPRHAGLGSGTQIALAAAKAVAELFGREATPLELARITGRGGTSGIGTAAFDAGGFIIDGGHRFGSDQEKTDFRPSSASRGVTPAPVTIRHPFPEDWGILLVTPDTVPGASEKAEVDIFSEYCPVPRAEVQEICHLVMMQMLPALVEGDMHEFGRVVNRLQEIGFKRHEVELQPDNVRNLPTLLCEAGAYGAGLSSFGPTVFAIIRKGDTRVAEAARRALAGIGGTVEEVSARNCGAVVRRG